MTKISEQSFDNGALFDELAADPSAPAAGLWRQYPKSDGMYLINAAGTVVGPLAAAGGAGNVLASTVVALSADQNVSGSGTSTAISWDTEQEDTDGVWAVGNPTKLIVPAGLNGRRAIVYGQVEWTASSGGTYRQIFIGKNGANGIAGNSIAATLSNAVNARQPIRTKVLTLATGDTFELYMRTATTGIGAVGNVNETWFGLYTVD